MRYGSIYLVVKNFNKSLDFYEKLLDMKVSARNGERFAVFNNDGLNICLFNGYYDAEHPEQMETKGESYPIYDDSVAIVNTGVAITTWSEVDPVCTSVKASEVVAPTCPNIDKIRIIKYK